MAYIYRILNKISKKCYIGETKCKDVTRRWNQHKQTIEINKGCPALRDAVKKYGIDNFEFSVLIICFDDERFKYEIEYIKKYNSVVPNGYNLTNGGEGGGFQGKTHTEEVKNGIKNKLKQKYIDNPELKKQMSERNKIVMSNPEVRDKIKNGILNSEKMKKNIEDKRTGNYKQIKHTEERKNQISESLKKYHASNVKNELNNKIKQCDMNNNLLNEYTSISDASRKTSIQRKLISLYLRGKTNIAGGYKSRRKNVTKRLRK
jgi:group I intron endonuclease